MDHNDLLQLVTRRVIEKLNYDQVYKIPIGVSSRHIHLCQKDLERLFGNGAQLTKKSDLKQPGQFASNETVTIRGPKGEFEQVRILGPVRMQSQVEISRTDSFRLGIRPPLRESGDLSGTPGIELVGPRGCMLLPYGAIIALRHIHMNPDQAYAMGIKDKEIVKVETFGRRSGIFGNVLVRVAEQFSLEMHVDTDEANACLLNNGDSVLLRKK